MCERLYLIVLGTNINSSSLSDYLSTQEQTNIKQESANSYLHFDANGKRTLFFALLTIANIVLMTVAWNNSTNIKISFYARFLNKSEIFQTAFFFSLWNSLNNYVELNRLKLKE